MTASINITSAGFYLEDHPLRLVDPNLWPLIEETNSYLLSYWSTISGTNSPVAGPAAAVVIEKEVYCTILYKQKC